jgi:hypothetical protein
LRTNSAERDSLVNIDPTELSRGSGTIHGTAAHDVRRDRSYLPHVEEEQKYLRDDNDRPARHVVTAVDETIRILS